MLLKSASLVGTQRDMWKKVFIKESVSSEESGEEDIGDGEKRQVLQIKVLPWRVSKVEAGSQSSKLCLVLWALN